MKKEHSAPASGQADRSDVLSDGGPAFPASIQNLGSEYVLGFTGDTVHPHSVTEYRGMSVRDYFAAAALQGYIVSDFVAIHDSRRAIIAATCYAMADAMLAARLPHVTKRTALRSNEEK